MQPNILSIRPNYSPEIQERRKWLIDRINEVGADVLNRDDIHVAYEEFNRRTQPFYDELLKIEQVQTSLIAELS